MSDSTQKVFISVPEAAVALNLLEGDFLSGLLKRLPTHIFVLLVPVRHADLCRERYGSARVLVESVPELAFTILERVLRFLNNLAFGSGTSLLMHLRGEGMMGGFIPIWMRRAIGRLLFASPTFAQVIRFCYVHIPTQESVEVIFDKHRPILVFSTILQNIKLDQFICHIARK